MGNTLKYKEMIMKKVKTLLVSLVLAAALCGVVVFAVVTQPQLLETSQSEYEQMAPSNITHNFTTPTTLWSTGFATSFAGGDGSVANPYIIQNPAQLARMGVGINAFGLRGAHFRIVADINLAGHAWFTVGNINAPFNGSIVGAHPTRAGGVVHIINMRTSVAAPTTRGLISYAAAPARISNIYFSSAEMDVAATGGHGFLIGRIHHGTVPAASNQVTIENIGVDSQSIMLSRVEHGSIGGIVGMITGHGAANFATPSAELIAINNVVMSGTVGASATAGATSVGGIVGSITNIETDGNNFRLNINNTTVDNDARILSMWTDTESMSVVEDIGGVGGFIGSVNPSRRDFTSNIETIVTINGTTNNPATFAGSVSTTNSKSVGGFIGNVAGNEGAPVAMPSTRVYINNFISSGSITGAANAGGVIGSVGLGGGLLSRSNIDIGAGTVSGMISSTGTEHDGYAGGLIGMVVNHATVDMNRPETIRTIAAAAVISAQRGGAGGLVGVFAGFNLDVDGAVMSAHVNSSGSRDLSNYVSGGIVGRISVTPGLPFDANDTKIVNVDVQGLVQSRGNAGGIVGDNGWDFGDTNSIGIVIENANAFGRVISEYHNAGGIIGHVVASMSDVTIRNSIVNPNFNFQDRDDPAIQGYTVGGVIGKVGNSNIASQNYTILIDNVDVEADIIQAHNIAGGIIGEYLASRSTGTTNTSLIIDRASVNIRRHIALTAGGHTDRAAGGAIGRIGGHPTVNMNNQYININNVALDAYLSFDIGAPSEAIRGRVVGDIAGGVWLVMGNINASGVTNSFAGVNGVDEWLMGAAQNATFTVQFPTSFIGRRPITGFNGEIEIRQRVVFDFRNNTLLPTNVDFITTYSVDAPINNIAYFTIPNVTATNLGAGRRFRAWHPSGVGMPTSVQPGEVIAITLLSGFASVTMEAQFYQDWHITFDNHDDGTALDFWQSSDESYLLPTPTPRLNQHFAGWYSDDSPTRIVNLTIPRPFPTRNRVYTAAWEDKVTATFINHDANIPDMGPFMESESFALPSLANRTGQNFHGWLVPNQTNPDNPNGPTITRLMQPGDQVNATIGGGGGAGMMVITAQWSINVTFGNHADGDNLNFTQVLPTIGSYQTSFTLPNMTSDGMLLGHTFVGWRMAPDNFYAGNVFNLNTGAGHMSFEARWNRYAYVLTFVHDIDNTLYFHCLVPIGGNNFTFSAADAFNDFTDDQNQRWRHTNWRVSGEITRHNFGSTIGPITSDMWFIGEVARLRSVTFNHVNHEGSPIVVGFSGLDNFYIIEGNAFTLQAPDANPDPNGIRFRVITLGNIDQTIGASISVNTDLTFTVNWGLQWTFGNIAPDEIPAMWGYNGHITAMPNTPPTVRPGYTFRGWAYAATPTVVAYLPLAQNMFDSGRSEDFVGVWHATNFEVQYNANRPANASFTVAGTMAPSTHAFGTTGSPLISNQFSLPGWVFMGWATTHNGNVIYLDAVNIQRNFGSIPDADNNTVNLYAVWQQRTILISYDVNLPADASGGLMTSSSHTFDATGNLSYMLYTVGGWRFVGWVPSADSAVVAVDGASLTADNSRIFNWAWNYGSGTAGTGQIHLNLIARWVPDVSMTVSFEYNGATSGNSETSRTVWTGIRYDQMVQNDIIVTHQNGVLPTPSRTNHTFGGWWTEDGTGDNWGVRVYSDTIVSAEASHTLYARWLSDNFEIVFNRNLPSTASGNVTGTMNNIEGTFNQGENEVTRNLGANNFALNGWEFIGWALTSGGTVAHLSGATYTFVRSDFTNGVLNLYAVWNRTHHVITLIDEAAGWENVILVPFSATTNISLPTRTNISEFVTFGGWTWTPAADSNGINQNRYTLGESIPVVTEDRTLTAVWVVTFNYMPPASLPTALGGSTTPLVSVMVFTITGETNKSFPNPATDWIGGEALAWTLARYNFTGWWLDSTTFVPVANLNVAVNGLTGGNFAGEWVRAYHIITFRDIVTGNETEQIVAANGNFNLPGQRPARNDGMTVHSGWVVYPSLASFEYDELISAVGSDMIFYAQWTLTFDFMPPLGLPTHLNSTLPIVTASVNISIVAGQLNLVTNLYAPVEVALTDARTAAILTMFNFGGWTIDGNTVQPGVTVTGLTAGERIQGVWTRIAYEFVFEHGHGGSSFARVATIGQDFTFVAADAFADRTVGSVTYRHIGWHTLPNQTMPTSFFDEYFLVASGQGNTTFYAVWARDFVINYTAPDGVTHNNPTTFNILTNNTTFAVPTALPNANWTFVRWEIWAPSWDYGINEWFEVTALDLGMLAGLAGSNSFENGAFVINSSMVAAGLNIRAFITFAAVSYNNLHTTHSNPTQLNTDTVANHTLTNPSNRTGWTFEGWYSTETFDAGTRVFTIYAMADPMDYVNITLWARWETVGYIITFENLLSGDTNPNQDTFTIGDLPLVLYDASRIGWTFNGWYSSAIGGTRISEINEVGDITLHARWTRHSYVFTFVHGHGGTDFEILVPIAQAEFNLPAAFADRTNPNFRHTGWIVQGTTDRFNIDHSFNTVEFSALGDTTFVAEWTAFWIITVIDNYNDTVDTFDVLNGGYFYTPSLPNDPSYNRMAVHYRHNITSIVSHNIWADVRVNDVTQDITLTVSWAIVHTFVGPTGNIHIGPQTPTITVDRYVTINTINFLNPNAFVPLQVYNNTHTLNHWYFNSNEHLPGTSVTDLDLQRSAGFEITGNWTRIAYEFTFERGYTDATDGFVRFATIGQNFQFDQLTPFADRTVLGQHFRHTGWRIQGETDVIALDGFVFVGAGFGDTVFEAVWTEFHTITFTHTLGGAVEQTLTVLRGENIYLPGRMSGDSQFRAHVGWTRTPVATSPVAGNLGDLLTNVTENLSFTATFAVRIYVVGPEGAQHLLHEVTTIHHDTGSNISFTVPHADWANFPARYNDGWTLTQWSFWSGGETPAPGANVVIAAQNQGFLITGNWTLRTFNLTFNNVEASEHTNVTTFNINQLPLDLSDADRSGWVFRGWYTTSTFDTNTRVTQITTAGDQVLYARWQGDFVITWLDADGAIFEAQYAVAGDDIVPPNTTPIAPAGYRFIRWQGFIPGMRVTGDHNFTPVFVSEPVEYFTVRWLDANGDVLLSQQLAQGSVIIAHAAPNAPTGYRFVRWVGFTPGMLVTGAHDFTALYENEPIEYYTITWIGQNNQIILTQRLLYGSAIIIQQGPIVFGYRFIGWDDLVPFVTGDHTFTAIYESLTMVTVVFDSAGGSSVADRIVEIGTAVTRPTDPTKESHTFRGWYFEGVRWDFNNEVTQNMTLIARWDIDAAYYYVTFNLTYGTHTNTMSFNATTVREFSDATRAGWIFLGWFDAPTGGERVNGIELGTTGDFAVWGRWAEQTVYNLTFNNVAEDEHTNRIAFTLNDLPFELIAASREGYTFLGWYTTATFDAGTRITQITTTGDQSLYARWEAIDTDGRGTNPWPWLVIGFCTGVAIWVGLWFAVIKKKFA